MEQTEEQKLFQTIIEKAWEDATFKQELISNPAEAIEKLTGQKVQLPEGKKLIVRDQMDDSKVFINIPAEPKIEDLELNEEQLEAVAGGCLILPTLPIIDIIKVITTGGDAQA